ncbi:MAG: PqqD family peptide modification chaperone [Planctomycetota bacterium]|nr:PqqD family peptide modification chaperone [Planctomycetota bacterium]
MHDRPTFSPFWHRVRVMRPRLRPHVQITRQHYRGQRWHVVHDPGNNQFYRLNPVAYECVGLLDGRRTVEEVWKLALTRHGDMAPTQNELIQLISQLYNSNLLAVDDAPDTEQLLRRGQDRRNKKIRAQAMSLMYFKIRLINPDRILTWLEPIFRPVLNRVGLVLWAALVLAALVAVIPHFEELASGVDDVVAPSNWLWLGAVFVVTKLIHETGHGLICKRFGGQVPELGFMMLVLFPAPYVDASAAWGFESKWRRIAVGAGGMIFELFVAAIAAFGWLATRDEGGGGSLISQICYNAMFTASVSTVIFNANPLMRFDGYYILSDLIEMPNLMQRSQNMLKHLAQVYIYRVKDATPPSYVRDEQVILVVYGLLAIAYRVFLFITITLYVMGKFFALGLFLAIWSTAVWFIVPIAGFVHWLATNPKLADHRTRAVFVSLLLLAAGAGLLGLVPWPDHRRGEGVISSAAKTGVFAGVDGFVTEVYKRPGDLVTQGEKILSATSPELDATISALEATLDEVIGFERRAIAENPSAAEIAAEKIRTLREQLASMRDKRERLIVRAPHDGVVVGRDPATLHGAFLKEGSEICTVVDPSSLRVTATLSQAEASWLFQLKREDFDVQMRLASNVPVVLEGDQVRVIEAAQRELPHAALSFAGGGTIATDQQDQSGRQAMRGQWELRIDPLIPTSDRAAWAGLPGERVHLRFTLPSKPLLTQWLDGLRKATQGKVDL